MLAEQQQANREILTNLIYSRRAAIRSAFGSAGFATFLVFQGSVEGIHAQRAIENTQLGKADISGGVATAPSISEAVTDWNQFLESRKRRDYASLKLISSIPLFVTAAMSFLVLRNSENK
jgi:ferritin